MPLLSLLLGVFAGSTAVIWVKYCTVDPVLLTGLRLSIAALLLAPLAARDWRRHRAELTWGHLRDAVVPGIALSAHLMTWMLGARMTLAANGTLIVNMSPLVTPFLLAAFMGERITRREIAATATATLGLAVLFFADVRVTGESLAGDLICLGSMGLLSVYLTLGRKFRHHPTNLLYMTPVFAVAAAVAFLAAPFVGSPAVTDWRAEAPWVVLLAIVPTIFGHSLIVGAMRHFRGQTVAVLNMTQFVFATALAWPSLGETPSPAFYPAAALILAAGAILLTPRPRLP